MKIAYLVNQYPLISHSFIRREIKALESLGVDIHRFSIRSTLPQLIDASDIQEYGKTTVILNINILRMVYYNFLILISRPLLFLNAFKKAIGLGWKSRSGLMKYFAYFIEAGVLKVLTGKLGIGHVHAHFGTNSTTVALLCRLLGGPPYSFTVHGPEEFDDPKGLGIAEKIRYAKFVAGVSQFGRSQLMRVCGPEFWDKIHIVRCTVDNSFIEKIPSPAPDTNRLVCIGRICAQKGQLILLSALHELNKRNVDFEMVIAGDGEMRPLIEEKIKEYSLNDRVRITGWLAESEVKKYILDSRAVILPSLAEGLPVVIMEAFSLGRPVIAACIAGIPELVENNISGYLVPAGSARALSEAIIRILNEAPPALTEMGRQGRIRVQEHHWGTAGAQKIQDLIHKE